VVSDILVSSVSTQLSVAHHSPEIVGAGNLPEPTGFTLCRVTLLKTAEVSFYSYMVEKKHR